MQDRNLYDSIKNNSERIYMVVNLLKWIDKKVTESLDETQSLLEEGCIDRRIDLAFRKEQRFMGLYERHANHGMGVDECNSCRETD